MGLCLYISVDLLDTFGLSVVDIFGHLAYHFLALWFFGHLVSAFGTSSSLANQMI